MDDRTLMVEEAGERTQMAATVTCPVCDEANVAGTEWCAECGFRLSATPGEIAPPAPAFALVGGGQRYPLKSGENVVGRLEAEVFLSDPSVSRRHAVITVGEDGVTVRDENSSNGTRMNNMRIAPGATSPLLPGETVQFGAMSFTLEAPEGTSVAVSPVPEAPPAPELLPEAEPAMDQALLAETPALAVLTNGADVWPLREGRNVIGRRNDCDVVLPDAAVSGHHATITIEGGEARIADTGSTNGTFLSEQRLIPGGEAALPPGAVVRFGRLALNYEVVPQVGSPDEAGEATDVTDDEVPAERPAGAETEG